MEEIFIIHNGEVVLPDKVLSQGAVVLEGNLIREICPKGQWEDRYPGVRTLDVQGNFVFPGFIDIDVYKRQPMRCWGVTAKRIRRRLWKFWKW